jgi:beta-glucanase (GH16 family)
MLVAGGAGLVQRSAHAGPAASPPLDRAPDGRRLVLAFDDEFDRDGPGPGRVWRTTYGDGRDPGVGQRTQAGNGEMQLYVDRDYGLRVGAGPLDPFSVRSGVLHIRAEPTAPGLKARLGGFGYTSGLISSLPAFSQRYGYFEIRARLPRGKGLWPAFWMLPADGSWPPEIDVMESIGDPRRVFLTLHSKSANPDSVPTDLGDDGFHTFAVSWDQRSVVWYVDGVQAARQPTPPDMHKPMYLVANLAVGGHWPGAPDASTAFPADFAIDYVRAYRFADPS